MSERVFNNRALTPKQEGPREIDHELNQKVLAFQNHIPQNWKIEQKKGQKTTFNLTADQQKIAQEILLKFQRRILSLARIFIGKYNLPEHFYDDLTSEGYLAVLLALHTFDIHKITSDENGQKYDASTHLLTRIKAEMNRFCLERHHGQIALRDLASIVTRAVLQRQQTVGESLTDSMKYVAEHFNPDKAMKVETVACFFEAATARFVSAPSIHPDRPSADIFERNLVVATRPLHSRIEDPFTVDSFFAWLATAREVAKRDKEIFLKTYEGATNENIAADYRLTHQSISLIYRNTLNKYRASIGLPPLPKKEPPQKASLQKDQE